MILELGAVGVIDWDIAWLEPMPGIEFLTHLKRGRAHFTSATERDTKRLGLMKQILLDLREQTDFLVEPAPSGQQPAGASAEALALLREIATTTKGTQDTLRPIEALWQGMLPLRRQIARWCGRI